MSPGTDGPGAYPTGPRDSVGEIPRRDSIMRFGGEAPGGLSAGPGGSDAGGGAEAAVAAAAGRLRCSSADPRFLGVHDPDRRACQTVVEPWSNDGPIWSAPRRARSGETN